MIFAFDIEDDDNEKRKKLIMKIQLRVFRSQSLGKFVFVNVGTFSEFHTTLIFLPFWGKKTGPILMKSSGSGFSSFLEQHLLDSAFRDI